MVERNLPAFDEIASKLGVKVADDSPIKKDFHMPREFLHYKMTLQVSKKVGVAARP